VARRFIVAPPDLADAHAQFKETLRVANRMFIQTKRSLGYCLSGTCMDKAEPDKKLCKYHSAYQSRWQRNRAADIKVGKPRRQPRAECELHGNYYDVCGCDPNAPVAWPDPREQLAALEEAVEMANEEPV